MALGLGNWSLVRALVEWVNKDGAFEKIEMQKMRGSHFDGKIMFDMMTDKK